jgi:DNA-binding transcriptional MerR regulator
VALRGFGFPLSEIGALLDDPDLDAGELVRRQLAQVSDTPEEFERMAEHRRQMSEQLTPEQRSEMAARRQAAWEAATPEERERLIRSRPPVPH